MKALISIALIILILSGCAQKHSQDIELTGKYMEQLVHRQVSDLVRDTFLVTNDKGQLYLVPGTRSKLCNNPRLDMSKATPYKGMLQISNQVGIIYRQD